jgi:hypothetical protein
MPGPPHVEPATGSFLLLEFDLVDVVGSAAARGAPGAVGSTSIENDLGFPTRITGDELAEPAQVQFRKFRACLPLGTQVVRQAFEYGRSIFEIDEGETVLARCLLIVMGACGFDYERSIHSRLRIDRSRPAREPRRIQRGHEIAPGLAGIGSVQKSPARIADARRTCANHCQQERATIVQSP